MVSKTDSKIKPTGWSYFNQHQSDLIVKIFSKGRFTTSIIYFKIPIVSLERLFTGAIRAAPVFDEQPRAVRPLDSEKVGT